MTANNYGIGSVVNGMTPQKTVTSPPQSNYYEVTETNELNQAEASVNFDGGPQFTQDDLNGNEINAHNYPASRVSLTSPNSRYSSSSDGMQADLRSSLHVVFPDSESSPSNSEQVGQEPAEILATDQQQQIMHGLPFFRQPLSTTQLHGILNSYPYNKDQQQQDQQFPQLGASSMMTFSQPQMHPFHYEEQSNEQQQQQQLMAVEQDYGSDQVSTDDNNRFDPNHLNAARGKQDMEYTDDSEFEVKPTTASSIDEQQNLDTISYSILPSRQAAEKLAALAAAGNVNSQLIKKLKKQQSDNNKSGLDNHKESYQVSEQLEDEEISGKMDYSANNEESQKQVKTFLSILTLKFEPRG